MKSIFPLGIAVLAAAGAAAGAEYNSEAQPRLEEQEHVAGDAICDPNVKQYTGYFKLHTGVLSKNYFYWFFESRNDPTNDPVVLWLTGGPGCSSEVALFGENGPCTTDGANTTLHPASWNSKANLLYVDQPTGTGFSYGAGLDHDEAQVSADMYDFLQQFFTTHSQYQKNKLFTFGESYAGHYIPAVAHKVWQNNQKLPTGAVHLNLQGVAVGNGLTDPEIQYSYYPDMAISTNGHSAAVGKLEYDAMKLAVPPCIAAIKACQTGNSTDCLAATEVCNAGLLIPYQLTGLNPYDMREKCQVPPLCYDFSNVGKYLKLPAVVDYLGVSGHNWEDCNRAVALEFELAGDWMHNFQDQLPDLLAASIPVLIYVGDQDYICNYLGNQAWALALDWPHKADFNAATPANFTAAGAKDALGKLRTSNGFSFLQVYNAGHMVPRDQPQNALDMLDAFLDGTIH